MQAEPRIAPRASSRWIATVFLAVATSASLAAEPGDTVEVWVTVLPQREIVERVGGDAVEVRVLVEPGRSPETYAPTSQQLAALLDADLYLRTGIPFERSLVPRIQELAPGLRVVDLREGLDLMPAPDGHGTHDSDDAHHDHGDLDPHVWLDPTLVVQQAASACHWLCELDPTRCETFRANLERYRRELEALDGRLAALLEPCRDRTILVFHPAYGYLARRYHLRQLAVEVSGKEPSPRQLAMLVEAARATDARALFVQPQFAGRAAEAAARTIGAKVVELDPLAPDLLVNLERMARRIAEALEADP